MARKNNFLVEFDERVKSISIALNARKVPELFYVKKPSLKMFWNLEMTQEILVLRKLLLNTSQMDLTKMRF